MTKQQLNSTMTLRQQKLSALENTRKPVFTEIAELTKLLDTIKSEILQQEIKNRIYYLERQQDAYAAEFQRLTERTLIKYAWVYSNEA